ncbi:hypothetical protein SH501x_003600 [Pirellulaceae bacterium SH501]
MDDSTSLSKCGRLDSLKGGASIIVWTLHWMQSCESKRLGPNHAEDPTTIKLAALHLAQGRLK